MNGLSDVRLMLHSQELHEGQAPRVQKSNPPGLSRWGVFRHRWVTRKALLDLDAKQLCDVGISLEQARSEGLKPFWRG